MGVQIIKKQVPPYGKSWLAIAAVFFCIFGFSACQRPNQPQVIEFAFFGDPITLQAYTELVEAFNTSHPETEVRIRHSPSQHDYHQRLILDQTSRRMPDVFLLNYRRLADYAISKVIQPVDPFFSASQVIHPNEFFPTSLAAFTYKDDLWCIPQNLSSLVVYYNRSLFEFSGIPLPNDQWTWEDFTTVGIALTKDLNDDGMIDQYGIGFTPSIYRASPFIWQSGGELVDDPENPTQLTLNTPNAKAALQWLIDLQTIHHSAPDRAAETAISSENRFLNGSLGMYLNSRVGVPTYRTIDSFDWDIAPLPHNDILVGVLHSDGFCMARDTKNPDAAWTFIEFANSPDGQRLIARSGRTVPSLIAVANSDAFINSNLPPRNAEVFLNKALNIRTLPLMPRWPAVEEIINKEFERAFYGETTLEEAIRRSEQLTQGYFQP